MIQLWMDKILHHLGGLKTLKGWNYHPSTKANPQAQTSTKCRSRWVLKIFFGVLKVQVLTYSQKYLGVLVKPKLWWLGRGGGISPHSFETAMYSSRWWFQMFLEFSPLNNWGNDPIWRLHIFQMGWFNHQLVMYLPVVTLLLVCDYLRPPDWWRSVGSFEWDGNGGGFFPPIPLEVSPSYCLHIYNYIYIYIDHIYWYILEIYIYMLYMCIYIYT